MPDEDPLRPPGLGAAFRLGVWPLLKAPLDAAGEVTELIRGVATQVFR